MVSEVEATKFQLVEDLMDQAIEECQESDPEGENALGCVLDAIEELPEDLGHCLPRLTLLTQEDCVPCDDTRLSLRPLIDAGKIDEVDIATNEGLKLMADNDLLYTPTLALLDCNGNLMRELFPAE